MASLTEQLNDLYRRINGLQSRLTGLSPDPNLLAATGERISYGCKVTEGSDDTDMIVALEGEASGDTDNLNPDLSATPAYPFEYANIAFTKSGGFFSGDLEATLAAVPGTGLARYDIAYIFNGPAGPGFAVATGTPSEGVKTAYDNDGLVTTPYDSGTDAALPVGVMPVARIYVEDDVTGIPDSRIADIRDFAGTLQGEAFTYDDLTPTQKNELASGAIVDVTALKESAEDAEEGAETAAATATTQAGVATAAKNDATTQAGIATGQAQLAAEIVNIDEVQTFTSPLARAPAVAMTESASVGGISQASNLQNSFNTGDFSVVWKGSVAALTSFITAVTKFTTSGGNRGFGLYLTNTASDYRRLRMGLSGDIGENPYYSTVDCDFSAGEFFEVCATVKRETVSAAGTITFYVNGVPLGAPVAIAAGAIGDIDTAEKLYVSGQFTGTVRHSGNTGETILYNRALAASEVLSLYMNGPAASDIYGSQVNLIPEPIDLTNASWSKFQCTIDAGAVTGPDGVTPADVIVPAVGVDQADIRYVIPPVVGKKYRTRCKVKAEGYDQVTVGGFHLTPGAGGAVFNLNTLAASSVSAGIIPTIYALDDGWVFLSVESTLPYLSGPNFGFIGPTSFVGDGTSGLAVTEIKTVVVGITTHLSTEDAQSDTGQMLDRAHGNHALLPASGAKVIGVPQARQRKVQSNDHSWTATNEIQYLAKVNQAVVPGDAAVMYIDIEASATGSFDIGDGSDQDRYVAAQALVVGKNRVSLTSTPFCDGTNKKLTAKPTASYTGTISVTAIYYSAEA
ncbi:hypothetical protein PHACT_12490 [Pseudohongiella acticola]|uniref:Uncharacterized protein n=1 Tax=Pseudohongiella acticola TaxID=1524254 RepID=A0A1E8CGA9_9GAMM|nr:LamG-like jellyroll fold domain-containing protein [Pseudohongiella acticola]OFE11369.1 hypothetical protein PHACT_12490 [Pseudohongiella acticola]